MLTGYATGEGTAGFARRHDGENYRRMMNLTLSNVGMGTYLGNPDMETDELVRNAIRRSVGAGINVIDTAINYRAQRAERSVGRAVLDLCSDGYFRDELFISTKNGYVTDDSEVSGDFWTYVKNEYVDRGVIKAGDITSGYHCMTEPYLEDQLERSLRNLGLECIDLLYMHNAVEGQIKDVPREELLKRLECAFSLYEKKRREGVIRYYGMATWECFRVEGTNPQYLSLDSMVRMAREAGGPDHGFRFIQLPFNLYYDQAFMLRNQPVGTDALSILDAARRLGIGVFTSVPFMQGRLLQPGVMPEFLDLPPALRALQFIRSTPGVLAPLMGHKSPGHLDENLGIMDIPPIPEHAFWKLVGSMTAYKA